MSPAAPGIIWGCHRVLDGAFCREQWVSWLLLWLHLWCCFGALHRCRSLAGLHQCLPPSLEKEKLCPTVIQGTWGHLPSPPEVSAVFPALYLSPLEANATRKASDIWGEEAEEEEGAGSHGHGTSQCNAQLNPGSVHRGIWAYVLCNATLPWFSLLSTQTWVCTWGFKAMSYARERSFHTLSPYLCCSGPSCVTRFNFIGLVLLVGGFHRKILLLIHSWILGSLLRWWISWKKWGEGGRADAIRTSLRLWRTGNDVFCTWNLEMFNIKSERKGQYQYLPRREKKARSLAFAEAFFPNFGCIELCNNLHISGSNAEHSNQ